MREYFRCAFPFNFVKVEISCTTGTVGFVDVVTMDVFSEDAVGVWREEVVSEGGGFGWGGLVFVDFDDFGGVEL